MELWDLNLQLVTLGLSFLTNTFPPGSSWPSLTYRETGAQLPHVESIFHQPLVNWQNWLEYPHVLIGNTSSIRVHFAASYLWFGSCPITITVDNDTNRFICWFRISIYFSIVLVFFEALSLTDSHSAFANVCGRPPTHTGACHASILRKIKGQQSRISNWYLHENSSKNIRSPPHDRWFSKMLFPLTKLTPPPPKINICPQPWKGPFLKGKSLFNPSFFGRLNDSTLFSAAWWIRGTPWQSRRSLQFDHWFGLVVLGFHGGYLGNFYPFHKRIRIQSTWPPQTTNKPSVDDCFPRQNGCRRWQTELTKLALW